MHWMTKSKNFSDMVDVKLYNGDCLEKMQLIDDNSIDCVICDLPYEMTNCKWDSVIPFDKLWEQYKRVCKPTTAIVLFGSEPFSSYLRMSNIEWFRYDWIWVKTVATGFLNSKKQPLKQHETISVFSESTHIYNPQGLVRGNFRNGGSRNKTSIYGTYSPDEIKSEYGNYPKSVLCFQAPIFNIRVHPTQKPVDLLEYLVRTYTNEGDVVLDNTMGSGSTGVACVKSNRNFIGIELDKKYFNVAKRKLGDSLHGRKRLF